MGSYFLLVFVELLCQVYIVYMGERKYEEPELVSESNHEILSYVFDRLALTSYEFLICENYKVFCMLVLNSSTVE